MRFKPRLHSQSYAFVDVSGEAALAAVADSAVALFREAEGCTAIIAKEAADALGLPVAFECAWITLDADTALTDIGITAAVAAALGEQGIPCNVFAPIRHDHIFVPWPKREQALAALEAL